MALFMDLWVRKEDDPQKLASLTKYSVKSVFKWFNASVGCIIRACRAVLFWVQINAAASCVV